MKTNTQKLLLAVLFTLFIVEMISFYQSQIWIMFIIFVIFSMCAMQYARACREESEEELEDEKENSQDLQAKYSDLKGRNDRMKSEFENQVELNERKLEASTEEIAALNNQLNSAMRFDALKAILPAQTQFNKDMDAISLVPVIRSVIRDYHQAIKEAGIVVQISEPDEIIYVRAEEEIIRRLFSNIIDNAVKFIDRDGKIIITVSQVDDEAIVVVRDNGIGISESQLNHIFDINYQGDNSTLGNGLGLAQVKAIVDYLGGKIYARSTQNDGTGIFIHLQAE